METGDERLAVAAAHRLGTVRTDRWPMVAAYLLAGGANGEALAELAGLPSQASGWQVDQLVPEALREAAVPDLTEDTVTDVLARLLAQGLPGPGHPVVRGLGALATRLDYPGGRIGTAYELSEWLDCNCHEGSKERSDADRFEEEVAGLPPLRIPEALAAALVGG